MKLIVGLGNPGKKYIKTRHNVGFMVLDKLAKSTDEKFTKESKFNSEIAKIKIENKKIILAKPQTYMNKSGETIRSLISYFNISLDNVWIILDDIDLDIGKIRIRDEGSSGGHKGLESAIHFLGSEKFPRFRIGIRTDKSFAIPAENFVLEKFPKEEIEIIDSSIEKTIQKIQEALKSGINNASM